MYIEEKGYNLVFGETSTQANGIISKVLYDGAEYDVSGMFYNYFLREKVDGRYTADIPTNTRIFKTLRSQLPAVITEDLYSDIVFNIGGDLYAVRFYTTNFEVVAFTLKPYEET